MKNENLVRQLAFFYQKLRGLDRVAALERVMRLTPQNRRRVLMRLLASR
jgi:hypothetical protein